MSEHLPVDEVTVSRVDVLRTRVTLAGLQARQDRLRDAVNRSALTSTADRLDFLIAQRSPDETLAWTRRWRALGVKHPQPTQSVFARPVSLSVPKVKRSSGRKSRPVPPAVSEARQLEIAMRVLAAKEARQGRKQDAA